MEKHCYLKQVTPPDVLYHGTSDFCSDNINQNGLISEIDYNVHSTSDYTLAEKFAHRGAIRYGCEPLVYKIDCKHMIEDGFIFYQHPGILNAYITDIVPAKYLTL